MSDHYQSLSLLTLSQKMSVHQLEVLIHNQWWNKNTRNLEKALRTKVLLYLVAIKASHKWAEGIDIWLYLFY